MKASIYTIIAIALAGLFATVACSTDTMVENYQPTTKDGLALTANDGGVEPASDPITIWGPVNVVRDNGAPIEEVFTFELPEDVIGPFTLTVENNGVTSAVIELNGDQVFRPSDFKKGIPLLEQEVEVNQANEVSVGLRSEPGTSVVLTLTADAWSSQPTTLGTDGGVLGAGGVEVLIPPGALNQSVELNLTVRTVDGDPIIEVQPHVEFEEPVKVKILFSFWEPDEAHLAILRSGPLDFAVTNLATDDVSSFVHTTHFSSIYFAIPGGGTLLFRGMTPGTRDGTFAPGMRVTFTNGNTFAPPDTPHNCDLCKVGSSCDTVGEQCSNTSIRQDIANNLVYAEDVVRWLDPTPSADRERTKMSPDLHATMTSLAAAVANDPQLLAEADDKGGEGSSVGLALNDAFAPPGTHTAPASKHYSGRGVDLGLCLDKGRVQGSWCDKLITTDPEVRFAPHDDWQLGRLAELTFLALYTHTSTLAPQLSSARSAQVTPTTTFFVYYEPKSGVHDHVHADLAFRCPDPWSVWDSTKKRCRRPSYEVTIAGEAAAAGDVTSTPSIGTGAMTCSDLDPNTGTRTCTEEPDGGPGSVILEATVLDGTDAVFNGWECTQFSADTPTIQFPDRRSDIECTAWFECPTDKPNWNASLGICEEEGFDVNVRICKVGPGTGTLNLNNDVFVVEYFDPVAIAPTSIEPEFVTFDQPGLQCKEVKIGPVNSEDRLLTDVNFVGDGASGVIGWNSEAGLAALRTEMNTDEANDASVYLDYRYLPGCQSGILVMSVGLFDSPALEFEVEGDDNFLPYVKTSYSDYRSNQSWTPGETSSFSFLGDPTYNPSMPHFSLLFALPKECRSSSCCSTYCSRCPSNLLANGGEIHILTSIYGFEFETTWQFPCPAFIGDWQQGWLRFVELDIPSDNDGFYLRFIGDALARSEAENQMQELYNTDPTCCESCWIDQRCAGYCECYGCGDW